MMTPTLPMTMQPGTPRPSARKPRLRRDRVLMGTCKTLAAILLSASTLHSLAQSIPTNVETLVADFNHDGIPDLLALSPTSATGTITLGSVPYGTFNSAPTVAIAPSGCVAPSNGALALGNLVIADFNSDGIPDYFYACGNSTASATTIAGVLLGKGDATFTPTVTLNAPYTAGGVAGDFNKDGKLDLVLITYPNSPSGTGSQTPSLLFFAGNGDGTFATPVASPLGASATFQPGNYLLSSPVASDVDGDGYPDILLNAAYGYTPTSYNGATLVIAAFGNRKDGTFGVLNQGTRTPDATARVGAYPAANPLQLLAGHFTSPTSFDFAVPDTGTSPGILFVANTSTPGAISLAPRTKTVVTALQNATTATFTTSGLTDLAVANGTTISALNTNGDGTFSPTYSSLSISSSATLFTAADANGDGYSDIYTASVNAGTLSAAVSLVTGTATATSAPFSLPRGTAALTAVWPGNLNFNGSTATGSQTVNGTPTTVSLTSSLNPANTGDSVTFTANVASTVATTALPTGTITISDGSATLGSGAPDPSGSVTVTTTTLAPGTHSIQATYTGDSLFDTSVSPTVSQIVNQPAAVSPTLTWIPAPITAGTPLGGNQLNAIATNTSGIVIPGSYAYTPAAGTVFTTAGSQVLSVTFSPTDLVTYQVATLSVPVTVLSATQTPLTTNLLLNPGAELGLVDGAIPNWTPAGPGTPTVNSDGFGGDSIFPHTGTYDFLGQSGASDSLSQTVSILTGAVTTTLIDTGGVSANLSFWEQGLSQSNPSDDASVTLTFLDVDNGAISSVATPEVDSHDGTWKNLSSNYSVPPGTRAITYTMNFIRHSGSDLDAFVDDNSLILTTRAPAAPSAITLTVSSIDSTVTTVPQGAPVTLTATVISGGLAAAPGQVVFCDAAATSCTDIHRLGTAQLALNGIAAITFYPAAGAHTYKAVFLGTTSFLTSTSAASPLSVTATYPTATALTATGTTGSYSLSATVTGSTGPGAPTGIISFVDQTNSNAVLATATLTPNVTALSFSAATALPTGAGPIGVLHTDLNNDGKPDLVINNASANTISIRLGIGDGTFTTLPDLTTGRYPSSVAIGDFNSDGFRDLAVTNFQDGTVTIFLGNGDGTFAPGATIASTGTDSRTITTADFNRDGNLDLAIGHDNSVTVLLGKGDGTFTATTNPTATGNGPNYAILAADFNADGIPDIAVTNTYENTISILLGNGDGTFTTSKTPGTGSTPVSLAAADLNGDGKLDLAVADQGDNNVSILLGDGTGAFTLGAQPSVGKNPQGIAIADLDGDGIPDLVTANQDDNTVSILRGLGTGFFTLVGSPAVGTSPDRAAIADFNGDGIPDLATSNVSDGGISVLLTSRATTATAAVTNISPIGAGTHQVVATYSADTLYATSTSAPAALTATQSTPTLTWTPANLTYGTALGAQQLNAAATTPTGTPLTGTFVYTPASGTVLTAGPQTLSVTFTPATPAFSAVTATRTITITQATPTLVWATPAAITQGTALSGTQLNATATGVTGAPLPGTFVYAPAAGTIPAAGTQTLSVTFTPTDVVDYTTAATTVRLTVNGLALTSFTPNTANIGDAARTITLTGVGFTTGSVVQVNAAAVATAFVNSTTLTAIVPATNFAATGSLAITVVNAATSSRSQALPLAVSAPAASVTLTGPSTTQPGTQPAIALTVTNPYPVPLTATFTLAFASAVTPAIDDPAIQFATGGRTDTFTVAANSTAVPAIQIQAGTVAGTITIPLTLTAAGVNVTPATLRPVTIVVPAAVPAVTTATITRATGSFTVTIHGFSNTREVTTATFHFVPAAGAQIDTPDVTIPVGTIFSGWFGSTPSATYGSSFTYTQLFNVSDTSANIGSVQVTLTNAVGVSTTYTAQ